MSHPNQCDCRVCVPRADECVGCGAPTWTTEVEVVSKREGQPPRTVASFRLCEFCAERVERNVAFKVEAHALGTKLG